MECKYPYGLLAISAFNSYYSVKNMEMLFEWAKNNFDNFNVFVMDGASIYNLMASGHDEKHATKLTHKNDNNLINKIINSLINVGFSLEDTHEKIIKLSKLSLTEKYCTLYNKYVSYYESNNDFRNDCLMTTKDVLPNANELAVKYLLAELPIWFDIPYLLDVDSAVLVYKSLSECWKKICYGYGFMSTKQQFLIHV